MIPDDIIKSVLASVLITEHGIFFLAKYIFFSKAPMFFAPDLFLIKPFWASEMTEGRIRESLDFR